MLVALEEIRMINEVDRTKAEEGIKDKTTTTVALVAVIAMGVPLVDSIAMRVPLVQVIMDLATRTADRTTTTAGKLIPRTALDLAMSLLDTEEALTSQRLRLWLQTYSKLRSPKALSSLCIPSTPRTQAEIRSNLANEDSSSSMLGCGTVS